MTTPSPIVCVHGWAGGPEVWRPLLRRFQCDAGFANFEHVVTADQFLPCVFEILPGERAWVWGWSLGALLAVEAALRVPERVRGLVLLGGTPRFVSRDRNRGWPAGILRRMRQRLPSEACGVVEEFRRQMFAESEQEQALRFVEDNPLPVAMNFSPEGLAAGLDYLLKTDLTARLPELRCPVLWIHGAQDRICPAGALELLPETQRKVILPRTGHMPFWVRPREVHELISEFTRDVEHRQTIAGPPV